ncbi:hypothetical protein LSAT2_019381 [Lamellibrachia satsuma]|nr:hypothetical protein LSAT2_019381 [Lamellibrachia satsuma]
MKTYVFTNVFLAVLVTFLREVISLSPQKDVIRLSLVNAYVHGAMIRWSGLDVTLIDKCELSYQAESVPVWKILLYIAPVNNSIDLGQLQPNTSYHFRMVCQTKESQVKFASKLLSFTTLPFDGQSRHNTMHTEHGTTPMTVTKMKMTTRLGSHDTVLGVLVSLAGVGVVLAVSYCALSKYRRRRRIQRFLQFRNRTVDIFPNLAPMEDEDDMIVVE